MSSPNVSMKLEPDVWSRPSIHDRQGPPVARAHLISISVSSCPVISRSPKVQGFRSQELPESRRSDGPQRVEGGPLAGSPLSVARVDRDPPAVGINDANAIVAGNLVK